MVKLSLYDLSRVRVIKVATNACIRESCPHHTPWSAVFSGPYVNAGYFMSPVRAVNSPNMYFPTIQQIYSPVLELIMTTIFAVYHFSPTHKFYFFTPASFKSLPSSLHLLRNF